VTNLDRLKALKAKHRLTNSNIADLIVFPARKMSRYTVDSFFKDELGRRNVPNYVIEQLTRKLED